MNESYEVLLNGMLVNDGHLKNWSLLYPDGVAPKLAPVYDQLSTVAWPRFDRNLALKLGGARDFGRIDAEAFRKLARRVGGDPERAVFIVRETIERLRQSWRKIREGMPLFDDHAEALRTHWTSVPLLREVGELE